MSTPRKGWHLWGPATPSADAVYHVYPLGDLREHVIDDGGRCWCTPRRVQYERGIGIVHNAADGRELVEQHGVN